MRILIADSELAVGPKQPALGGLGDCVTVDSASSALAAIDDAFIRCDPFDLLVLDLELDGAAVGAHVVEHVRACEAAIEHVLRCPIVLIGGAAIPDAPFVAEIDAFLARPFSRCRLLGAISDLGLTD